MAPERITKTTFLDVAGGAITPCKYMSIDVLQVLVQGCHPPIHVLLAGPKVAFAQLMFFPEMSASLARTFQTTNSSKPNSIQHPGVSNEKPSNPQGAS